MKRVLLLLSLFLLYEPCFSQGVNSGGETITASSGSIEYSIGQVSVETLRCVSNYITQGIIQPSTSFYILAANHEKEDIGIKLFPNPTSRFVNIESEVDYLEAYLSNQEGKVLKAYSKGNLIDLSQFKGNFFFLSLYFKNQQQKTYKIIKN